MGILQRDAMVYVHSAPGGAVCLLDESVNLYRLVTFLITVCMVYDFSRRIPGGHGSATYCWSRQSSSWQELEQRAAEKKRLLEAASTFAKEAVSEKLADTKEALAERLPSVETPDPGQLKEKVLERLEKEMAQLEDRQEQLKERMTSGAAWFLTHNPGSRFMNAGIDRSTEIRESAILKRKNTKQFIEF